MEKEATLRADFMDRCFKFREALVESLENPAEAERKVFRHIISVVRNTEYARAVGISDSPDVEEFKKRIPISDYDGISPWLDEQASAGNSAHIVTNDTILRWLKTSGTSSKPKKIPYTSQWIFQYRVPALYAQWATYIRYCPSMLAHRFATLDLTVSREHPKEFLSNIPFQSITNRPHPLGSDDWCPPWHDEPWFSPDISHDYGVRTYHRLRYFLASDLRAIVAINPSNLIALKNYLVDHLGELCSDIERGTLEGREVMGPDPGTAERLLGICSDPDFNFRDIWPNLELIVCWTNSTARLYVHQLEKLFPGVTILPFMAVGTEGVVTIPVDDSIDAQPLAINQGFYEFVDADTDLGGVVGQPLTDTLSFRELELGKSYYLIMSQVNGMVRYLSSDVYQVAGYLGQVPLLRFSGRKGIYNSFTGEKLTEEQIIDAMAQTLSNLKMKDSLFYCCPVWSSVPYYRFLVESGDPDNGDLATLLSRSIDSTLGTRNHEYRDKRASGRLSRPDCKLVRAGAINEYYEKVVKKRAVAGQVKYNPFASSEDGLREFLTFCKVQPNNERTRMSGASEGSHESVSA